MVLWLWLVLWGAAFVVKESEEIRFDLLTASVGRRPRIAMGIVVALALVVLYGASLKASFDYVTFMKVEKSSYLKIRMDWLFSIFLVFLVAVIVRYVWLLWHLAARARSGGAGPDRDQLGPVSAAFAYALAVIVALSLLGLPVGHAMIAGSILYLWAKGLDMGTAAEQLLNGMYTSYVLLAIPLFILAAEFMNSGSIMDRLLRFCNALVGRWRGGLAQVNVLQSIVFASMSGSALADAAGSGKIMQTLMTRDGKYPAAYAAALSAASSVIGPIIPPSIPLVLYALVSDTSIGFLFLAGVVPGILLGLVQMGLIAATAKRRNFPVEERVPLRELPRITREAFPALMMPVILLGCLYSGITTPTEAAAAAAAYALLVSAFLYRSLSWADVYQSLARSARITISIGMLIAGALVFNYVVTAENIPKALAAFLKGYELSPLAFLLVVNLLLLALGCFLEGTTILLIIIPVLLPTAQALGVDPVHFGVVAVMNIMIGLITPPYGLLLFMMVKIAEVPLRDLVREVLPFLAVMIGALALITFVPDLVLVPAEAPRLQGLKHAGPRRRRHVVGRRARDAPGMGGLAHARAHARAPRHPGLPARLALDRGLGRAVVFRSCTRPRDSPPSRAGPTSSGSTIRARGRAR